MLARMQSPCQPAMQYTGVHAHPPPPAAAARPQSRHYPVGHATDRCAHLGQRQLLVCEVACIHDPGAAGGRLLAHAAAGPVRHPGVGVAAHEGGGTARSIQPGVKPARQPANSRSERARCGLEVGGAIRGVSSGTPASAAHRAGAGERESPGRREGGIDAHRLAAGLGAQPFSGFTTEAVQDILAVQQATGGRPYSQARGHHHKIEVLCLGGAAGARTAGGHVTGSAKFS